VRRKPEVHSLHRPLVRSRSRKELGMSEANHDREPDESYPQFFRLPHCAPLG
jgi:hypothetical protein